ncbi:MAG: methyltransferase domain-containing protein [Acidobacteriota bacterium]|nr:methyltransferase domain-containing protein [Acidobacteriota bacterium]
MGTGAWLVEMSQVCRTLGLDDHEESIALAAPRLQAAGGAVLKTGLHDVDLPDACATVVTMMDVLEHLDDEESALREMIRLTKPGGLLVITVPALPWLWSEWDVALHHRRRYQRDDLLRAVRQPGVELLRCAYINSAALLPVALVRQWQKIFRTADGEPRAEDKVPHRVLNEALYHSFVAPACWDWFNPPAGVSLLAVLRRG